MSRIRRLTFFQRRPPPEDVAQALYERFYDRTLRIVLSLIGDRECAIEATQEAFVRAFERFETLRDGDKFGVWVASIALNAARDILRRGRREIAAIEVASTQPSHDESVEETVLNKEDALSHFRALIRYAREESANVSREALHQQIHVTREILDIYGARCRIQCRRGIGYFFDLMH